MRRISSGCEVDWAGPSTIDRLDDLVAARHQNGQRVGVLGPLRFSDQHRLAASVGELLGLDRADQRLRLVKSAEEIERMEVAARLSDLAIHAIVDRVKVGMDERRVAAIIEEAYLSEGGTNHIHYLGALRRAIPMNACRRSSNRSAGCRLETSVSARSAPHSGVTRDSAS